MCVQHGKAGVDHGVEYSVGFSGECPDVPIEAVTFENISTYHIKYGLKSIYLPAVRLYCGVLLWGWSSI